MGLDHSAHEASAKDRLFRRNRLRLPRTLMVALVATPLVLLSGCAKDSDNAFQRLGLPVAASDRTSAMFNLWVGAWIAVLVVFVLVFGMIVWSMIRYRRRTDDEVPPQVRYNLPIEVLYTVTPVIVVAVFFFHTIEAQKDILHRVDNPEHTITVIGSQWQWTFDYTDEDAIGGDSVFDYGTPAEFAQLWLPVDQSVRFNLRSSDVIHSFWVPEFYFKLDVIPGKTNSFDLTPTREGTFTGHCAELCGLYHSRMLFTVHVVSSEEYDAHLLELKKAGQIGEPQGGAEAMTAAGAGSGNGGEQ